VGVRRRCGLADRSEQVLSGVDGVQDELAIVLRTAHPRQRPIGVVDYDQPSAGADGRSGGCRVVSRKIEDVGNVVVETDTDDPPLRERASSRLVLTAKFFLGGYLLRQADEVGNLAQGTGFLPGDDSVSVHVEPVLFKQLAVDLLDRCAGQPVASDQLTELTSLLRVDLAVVQSPV
jgi:hypothetical protein